MNSRRAGPGSRRAVALLFLGLIAVAPWAMQDTWATNHDTCAGLASAEVPQWADRDGAPFVVLLALTACGESSFNEMRVWIGDSDGGKQASRTWNGTSWTSSARYVPMPAEAAGALAVALQSDANATHAAAVQNGDDAAIWLRLRGPSGSTDPQQLGRVHWMATPTIVHVWGPDAGLVRNEHGALLASAPVGFDRDGWPAPSGYARVALPEGIRAPSGIAAPKEAIQIIRFAPSLLPGSWDFVELHVDTQVVQDLAGVRLSDGEGALVLPPHPVPVTGVLQLVGPGAARVPLVSVPSGAPPASRPDMLQLAWQDTDARWLRPSLDGNFALAKDGDSLTVSYGNQVMDVVVYGNAQAEKDGITAKDWQGDATEGNAIDGRLFLRARDTHGTFVDTNTAADWTHPRVYRQHQSDVPAAWSNASTVRAFVCPDRCLEEVLLRMGGAEHSLLLNLYDLSLVEVVEGVSAAARRGVDVSVLLHERPVGASATQMSRIAWAVDSMLEAGADVRTLNGTRFDVNHAKYLVVDETWTTILSENAVRSGWSPDGASGNRGWGVSVQDATLATWMKNLYYSDFLHPADAYSVTGTDFSLNAARPPTAVVAPAAGRLATLVMEGPVRVQPLVAPDHLGDPTASPLVLALENAAAEIWTQQLNLPLDWSRPGIGIDSPLAVAMREAAARGVAVRGTLAGSFEDHDPSTPGNDRTVGVFAALAAGGMPVDLRLDDGPSNAGIVHNKGWLVDPGAGGRNLVVVGSANGNLASQAMNREVDVMIEHPQIAAYFRAVLLDDWNRSPAWHVQPGDPAAALPFAGAPVTIGLLLVLVLAGRRRALLIPS